MSQRPSSPGLGELLVFGPPGAGVPLVTAGLVGLGIDALGWEGGPEPHPALDGLNLEPGSPVLVALDASDGTLLTRSTPPWIADPPAATAGLAARSLDQARERLFPARVRSDLLLDSTHLSERLLLARVRQLEGFLRPERGGVAVVVETFSYPRGVPLDLGWCLDARALRNPYWEPGLRMLSGLDYRVQEFVVSQPLATLILDSTVQLLTSILPELEARSRRVLRLGIGCTGGYHRSVALAEELARRIRPIGVEPLTWHRDLPERP
ncbi:MAG TPA: RNase adapter RapZ [Candidatus Dormibacteraeota bacterium]